MSSTAWLRNCASTGRDRGPRHPSPPRAGDGDDLRHPIVMTEAETGRARLKALIEEASAKPRKLPEPDEVADAVVFLASPMARAITGQCLDVNSGEYHR